MSTKPHVWCHEKISLKLSFPPEGVLTFKEAKKSLDTFFRSILGEYSEVLQHTILSFERNILWNRNMRGSRQHKKSARELRNVSVIVEHGNTDDTWIISFEAYVRREGRTDETVFRKVIITFDEQKTEDSKREEIEYELIKVEVEDMSAALARLHAHWIIVSNIQNAYSGGLPGHGKRR